MDPTIISTRGNTGTDTEAGQVQSHNIYLVGGWGGTQGSLILRRVEVKTTISFPTRASSTNNKQATPENSKENKIYDAGGEKNPNKNSERLGQR